MEALRGALQGDWRFSLAPNHGSRRNAGGKTPDSIRFGGQNRTRTGGLTDVNRALRPAELLAHIEFSNISTGAPPNDRTGKRCYPTSGQSSICTGNHTRFRHRFLLLVSARSKQ